LEKTKYEETVLPSGEPTDELECQLHQLYLDLLAVIERDPEQEITGIALPVVDWILSASRDCLAERTATKALTNAMVDLISPITIRDGDPIRALDTWLVVGQVLAAMAGRPTGGA
jgi:hypothetical protein